MKFHKVIIENITSLSGKNEIDFDSLLSGEQIFAITGATGSGKSSILAAISLALYGDSHKKSLNNDDFVTLGASYGRVILDFSIANKNYQSQWECRVAKKNGELLKIPKIQRSLSHNNKLLDITAAEILGLTFEQFCKTVILNQGEFSKFISSNFSKRRDILEKLHGSETLGQIGKQLTNKIKTWEIKGANLKTQLDTALPYQDEEIEQFRQNLIASELKLKQQTNIEAPSKELFSNFKDLLDLIFQYNHNTIKNTETKNKLVKAVEEFNAAKKEQKKIEIELKSKEAYFQIQSPKLQEATAIDKEIILSKKYCDELQAQIEHNQKRLSALESSLKNIVTEINTNATTLATLKDNNSSLFELDEETINKLGQSVESCMEIYNRHNLTQQNIESISNKISDDQKKIVQLKKQLKILEETVGSNSPDELQAQKDQLYESINQHRSRAGIFEQLSSLIAQEKIKIEQLKNNKEQIKIETAKSELKHEQVLDLFRKMKHEIEQLDLDHAKQKCLVESIKKHECIVCGGQIDNSIKKSTPPFKSVEELRAEERELYQQQADIEANIKVLAESKKNTSDQIKSTLSNLADLEKERINLFEPIDSKNIDPEQLKIKIKNDGAKLQNDLKKIEEKIKRSITATAQVQNYRKQIHDIEAEKNRSSKLQNENMKLLDKYQSEMTVIQEKILLIRPKYPQDLQHLARHFGAEEKVWREINRLNTKDETLKQQQSIINKGIHDLREQITLAKEAIQKRINENKELTIKKNKLCPEGSPPQILAKLTNDLQSIKIKRDGLQSQTHHKERDKERLSATLDTLTERQTDIDHTIVTTVTRCKTIAKDLAANLQSSDKSFDDALKKVADIDYQSSIIEKQSQFQYFFDAVLTPFCDRNDSEISTLKEDISQFKIKIQMYESKVKDQKEALKELQILNKRLYDLKDLQHLIGNNDFRNYILGLIEKQLLQYANKELASLCDGRYEIFQQEKRSAQEFYIIDHWKSGLPRKISTLSGGETFLVSLAMALSLADMTRGQTEIDSFYIDEGFGSLDHESIDEALDILSKVRSRGKQIGIISHVTSLTDRIPINIKLTKSQFGESSITLNNY